MDPQQALAVYDEQVRRHPPAGHLAPDGTVAWSEEGDGGWNGVTWSALDGGNADSVIAAQVARFAGSTEPWEWKYYSYDQPPDLPDRLQRAGFTREPDETLLVAEIADLSLSAGVPEGVRLHQVEDAADIDALVRVHDEVFGGDNRRIGAALAAGLAQNPPTVAAVLALAGATPVAAGRVEFPTGCDFAGLWGGGTVAAWRRRGAFAALVAYRARLAAERGYRYLQVDASPESRPILSRLGFVELATTAPFVYHPPKAPEPSI